MSTTFFPFFLVRRKITRKRKSTFDTSGSIGLEINDERAAKFPPHDRPTDCISRRNPRERKTAGDDMTTLKYDLGPNKTLHGVSAQ